MNWLDIVILCLAVVGIAKGLYDGMIKQIVSLAAIIVGIYLSSDVAGWMRNYLTKQELLPQHVVTILSYFIGFVLIAGIILIAGYVVHRLVSATPLSILNHIVGGILGLLLMTLFLSFIFNLTEIFDSRSMLLSREIKVESRLYLPVRNVIPALLPGSLFEN